MPRTFSSLAMDASVSAPVARMPWTTGIRHARGELAHSDAGVKKYPSTRMRAKELPQLYRAYISLPAVS
jgi:hypothetical protein